MKTRTVNFVAWGDTAQDVENAFRRECAIRRMLCVSVVASETTNELVKGRAVLIATGKASKVYMVQATTVISL